MCGTSIGELEKFRGRAAFGRRFRVLFIYIRALDF